MSPERLRRERGKKATTKKADPQNNTRHGQVLEKVSKAKYLGVKLTEGLNWSTRIQATIAEPKMGPPRSRTAN